MPFSLYQKLFTRGNQFIQRREAELNIILPRMNNFDIKQKKAWNFCFIICHQHQIRSGKIKTNKITKHSKFRSKHKLFL